jgi:sporulation integral membrane protein YlbJ
MKLKRVLPLAAVLALFASLLVWSAAAVSGARAGLYLCANVIVPTLLPFFVLSNLLCALGLPAALARRTEGAFRQLFGVGGAGAAAFLLGLTGGYPLGAAATADLYRSGSISRDEAQRLLLFCNNSGPAFILGMAGTGVFHSATVGLLLYLAHILAAAALGMIFAGREDAPKSTPVPYRVASLSAAIPEAMLRAVKSAAAIAGFVIFFSMLAALLRESGLFTLLAGVIYAHTPLNLGQSEALISGVLELGSGVAGLEGLSAVPGNLALCAFILGWGGLSVQFQTAAVLSGTGLRAAPIALAKLLHGTLSAVLAYALAALFL